MLRLARRGEDTVVGEVRREEGQGSSREGGDGNQRGGRRESRREGRVEGKRGRGTVRKEDTGKEEIVRTERKREGTAATGHPVVRRELARKRMPW